MKWGKGKEHSSREQGGDLIPESVDRERPE